MTIKNDATDTLPDRQPSVRAVAMPSDTNPTGDIFGGWLMSQMDLAAGTAAARRAKGRTATVFVDSMSFLRPVHVGDEVSFFTDIIHVGRTSLRINVQAWRQTRFEERSDKVTEGVFTFVALDEAGRPRPLDPDVEDDVVQA
ncbi:MULTISPECIES: acyl-CoA thioesterase [Thalassospira]|uniref:Acyl-CoA thioester hydrolase n=1 Tax=Thalassospira profundimaris TaxID=502049 RepID=A0A367V8U9_9PROT|nr:MULTISPECIES: acyl-CoA thioesterase [Thalassospira]KZB72406.1 acyl-CoA thioesterase [Thalassospira sp. MCCC 1A01148]RCK21617.1 acyl-CoA thioester hydrolase [Thalassospira profundimaris]